jgi:integrative and conjugative element protein (TIGR02256 family)
MSAWQNFFEGLYRAEIAADALRHPAAAAMAAMLGSGAYGGAKLVACRDGNVNFPDACLLIMDVEVGLGQRRVVNDIKPVERLAITYVGTGILPSVYPLRPGFPEDVPHLNLAARDEPRSLCLFEMPAEEVLRLATPHVLIERVRLWLRETAYGRLHGDDQPLDPLFMNSWQPVVLPEGGLIPGQSELLHGYRVSDHDGYPVILEPATETDAKRQSRPAMVAIVLVTRPLPHARLRMVPLNVAELLEAFEDMQVDLLADLQTALRTWPSKPGLRDLIKRHCLIVVRTPIERSPGNVGGEASKVFLTDCTAGVLAEKLGAFSEVNGYAGLLIASPVIEVESLKDLKLAPMDVYRPFDRAVAQAASGFEGDALAPVPITLVGAGALGSQVALTAARMGIGSWTVVDPDHLLPHNMARHGLSPLFIGWAKAEAVAYEIKRLLGTDSASAVVARIGDTAKAGEALSSARLVIDASASVPVARWLATTSRHSARTVSVFLNPSGNDLVILAEGEGRVPRLDHVEMAYYWALANGGTPEDHLADGRVGLYPSGGCRTPSLAISQADVGALAPLAAKRLLQGSLPPEGFIEIRRASNDGVAVSRTRVDAYREAALDDWTVAISADLIQGIADERRKAEQLETGGILVGTWDRVRKRVYVAGHYAPPPDSILETSGFVRGAAGVHQTLETVQRRTAGNLTYIGEWHTHPVGHQSYPSVQDRVLLHWIGDVLVYSDVPALMLIVGEEGVRVVMGQKGNSVLFGFEAQCAVDKAA